MKVAAIALALITGVVQAHGLSPTRVEAPAGSTLIAYRFTAFNNSSSSNLFTIECFKGGLSNPFPCNFSPRLLILQPNGSRTFKAQIETKGDGLYLVCTKQEPKYESQIIVTRVCARFGVGVPASTEPDNDWKHPTTKPASVSTRPRQG